MDNRYIGLESLEESWRWFGPADPLTVNEARQAGATGIVTALHEVPVGAVWENETIDNLSRQISAVAYEGQRKLRWSVVGSLAVHDGIKRGDRDRDRLISNWMVSLRNLAAAGIKRVAYHFMPVVDWVRTDLKWRAPADGSFALRFDYTAFIAFDVFILKRPRAADSYSTSQLEAAGRYFKIQSEADRHQLSKALSGLPGGHNPISLDVFRYELDSFRGIDRSSLRDNLKYFLREVIPLAEELGFYWLYIRMTRQYRYSGSRELFLRWRTLLGWLRQKPQSTME